VQFGFINIERVGLTSNQAVVEDYQFPKHFV